MPKDYSEHILFTGAGFTKNFGGLLAKEMWSKLFNNSKVQSYPPELVNENETPPLRI